MSNSTECVLVLKMSSDKEKTKSGPGEHRQGETSEASNLRTLFFWGPRDTSDLWKGWVPLVSALSSCGSLSSGIQYPN